MITGTLGMYLTFFGVWTLIILTTHDLSKEFNFDSGVKLIAGGFLSVLLTHLLYN
jgi:hypothetical protein